jgi:hypothetical protein
MTLRISFEEEIRIQKAAKASGLTPSALARNLIEEGLDRLEGKAGDLPSRAELRGILRLGELLGEPVLIRLVASLFVLEEMAFRGMPEQGKAKREAVEKAGSAAMDRAREFLGVR